MLVLTIRTPVHYSITDVCTKALVIQFEDQPTWNYIKCLTVVSENSLLVETLQVGTIVWRVMEIISSGSVDFVGKLVLNHRGT